MSQRADANEPSAKRHKSTLDLMIPYYPELKKTIRNLTSVLLLTYIEIHHPALQDPEERRPIAASLPVEVWTDELTAVLGIHRRTLIIALSAISTWFSTDFERLLARRSGREFLVRRHTQHPPYKLYAVVGPRNQTKDSKLTVYRNRQLLAATLTECGFPTFPPDLQLMPARPSTTDFKEFHATLPPVPALIDNLVNLQARISGLGGDRRTTRYERLRNAIKAGIAKPSALSRAKKSGQTSQGDVEGVQSERMDPVLPTAILERLGSR